MDHAYLERVAAVILSVILLAGSFILHARHSRPLYKVVVTSGSEKKEVTLAEADALLREKRKIDVNTASLEELVTIPGIGEGLASAILACRDKGDMFYSADDLLRIRGIGPKKLEKMREYIKFK